MAQRNHGVGTHGAAGGDVASQQKDGAQEQSRSRIGDGVGGAYAEQQMGDRAGQSASGDEAEQCATRRKRDSLAQHEAQDVRWSAAPSAIRTPNSRVRWASEKETTP